MKKATSIYAVMFATFLASSAAMTAPAFADFCFQLNGGPFSGDIGFFHFKGNRPVAPGQIVPLAGRAAGLSPAFGTGTVAKDGSFAEFGVTFFIDATQGQFDVSLSPPKSDSGSGYGDYGDYGTSQSVTVNVVNCNLEP